MRGRRATSAVAAPAAPTTTPTRAPGVIRQEPWGSDRRISPGLARLAFGCASHGIPGHPHQVRDRIRIPYRGMLPRAARPRERAPQRSGKSEGWLGEIERFRPAARLPRPGALAEGFGRSRLGRAQAFLWAILSPCLMTSRSARRAMGWAIRSRYLSQ